MKKFAGSPARSAFARRVALPSRSSAAPSGLGLAAARRAANVVLAQVDGLAALAAYIAYGVGQGLMTVVGSASWAKYFGPAHLGHIRGVSMTVGISCSALGPLVMGASVDYLGGFEPALWFFTAVAVSVEMLGAVAGGDGGVVAE